MKLSKYNYSTFLFVISGLIIFGSLPFFNNSILTTKFEKLKTIINYLLLPSKTFYEGALEFAYILGKPDYFRHPKPQLLVPSSSEKRFEDLNGSFNFNYEKGSKQNAGYLLLSVTDPDSGKPKIEIWDLNKQQKIHAYKIKEASIKQINKVYKKNISHLQLFHPLLLNDGSIIVNSNSGALIRLGICGNIIKFRNDLEYHHSIEKDNTGNIYVPVVLENESYFKSLKGFTNKANFRSEGFALLDKNLNLKKLYSLKDIFLKSGLLKDVLSGRNYDSDPFHLNDVDPLFVTNNKSRIIFLSLRHYGIMGYDVSNEKLLWVIKGLSNMQHDITPLNKIGTAVSVFDNGSQFNSHSGEKYLNTILKIKNLPVSQKNNAPSFFIGQNLKEQGINYKRYDFQDFQDEKLSKTITQGKGQYFNYGNNLYIEETNYGRIFEINLNDKSFLWEFINKNVNTKNHTIVSWSRRIEKLPKALEFHNSKFCKN